MRRLAALALVGSFALASCTVDDADQTPRPAPPSTAVQPEAEAAIPRGAPPRIPYVHRGRYITPRGREHPLATARRGVSDVVPFRDGFLVSDMRYFEGTNGVAFVRDSGTVQSWPSGRRCSSGTPATTSDGRYVAWVTIRCPESLDRSIGAIHRARLDGSGEVRQRIGVGLVGIVGFLGHRVVYNKGFEDGAWITDFRSPPRRIPGVRRVGAIAQAKELFIGGGGWRTVLDAEGMTRWRALGRRLMSFSPDETQVLAYRTRRQVDVLDSDDGSTLARIDLPAGASATALVWETDRTLLTVLQRGRVATLVRLHLDGRVERATPWAVERNRQLPPYVVLPPS